MFLNYFSEFWKKKIGISNVKVKMDELAESYLNHIDDDIAQYKIDHHHLKEKIINMRDPPEVALGRFLSNLWNNNGDDWLTVYELNQNTEKFGKDGDAIAITTRKVFQLEQLFMSKIEFFPLMLDAGQDHIIGNDDDELVLKDTHEIHAKHGVILNSNDMVITVRPFQRLTILCKVPRFNKDFYPHDCVAILKYDKITTVKDLGQMNSNSGKDQFTLHEIEGTRAYLSAEVNSEFHHRDIYYWNAPESIARGKNKVDLPLPDGNILTDNFLETKICPDDDSDENGNNNSTNSEDKKKVDQEAMEGKALEEGGVSSLCTMVYTPTIRKPGIYTVRLVLDELEIDSHDDIHSTAFKKKLALSQKNYYYNRSAEEREIFTSTRGAAICTTIQGMGINSFKHYVDLTLQLYDLDIQEAILEQRTSEGIINPGTSEVSGNNKNQLQMVYGEKEKFIQSNTDKVLDYINSKREKETTVDSNATKDIKEYQKESDLQALRELLHMDAKEIDPAHAELNILLDEIITKREETADPPKKGRRQSLGSSSAVVVATPPQQGDSAIMSPTQIKPTAPPSINAPKETIERMHDNPLFIRRASFSPSSPSAKMSAVSRQFEEIRSMTSFILQYCHDPNSISLEKENISKPLSMENNKDHAVNIVSQPSEIHHHKKKIVEILSVDLYTNYSKEVLECVKMNSFKPEELEYKKIVLAKIIILLKLTKVIILVEDYIVDTLRTWRDLLPNATTAILQQVDNSIREHKGLLSEHLLVRETIEKMIESSPISSKNARALVNFANNDGDISNQLATKALIHDGQLALFLQFYRIKISLYRLDAKEAIANIDITRLLESEKRMSELNELMVQVSKGKLPHSNIEKSTTSEIIKMIRNTLQPSREMIKKERNHHRVYSNHVIRFEDREKAVQDIDVFLKNLSTFIEKLQEKLLNEHDLTMDVVTLRQKIDDCIAIRQEFEIISENARHSPPSAVEIIGSSKDGNGIFGDSDMTSVTIEGLNADCYFFVAQLSLQIIDYNIQDAVKLGSSSNSVDHTIRIQKLRVEKEAMLKSVKDNVARYEAGVEGKENKIVLENLKSLIEIHDRIVSCDALDIKFDSFIEDLQSDTMNMNKSNGGNTSPGGQMTPTSPSSNSPVNKSSTLKHHKSSTWAKKATISLKDSLLLVTREFDNLEKQLFAVVNADHPSVNTYGRLSHVMLSIPRSSYTELVKEVKSALQKYSEGYLWDQHAIQELEKINIILNKVNGLYKLTKVIRDVDHNITINIHKWFDGLPISREISLFNVQETMKQQSILVQWHHKLIEDLRENIAETSNVDITQTCFLLDFDNEDGIDKLASEALVVKNQLQLFVRYYIMRIHLYSVDAHECIEIQDLHRLEMIEKRINLLNDSLMRLQLKKESDEKDKVKKGDVDKKDKDKEKNNPNASLAVGIKEAKRRIRELLEKEPFFNKYRQQRDFSRKTVIEQVNLFLVDLKKYHAHFSEQQQQLQKGTTSNSGKGSSLTLNIALTTKIHQLRQIADILQAILTRAEMAPPVDRTSYQNVTTPIIPPHGLIIHVENKNAMVWGQVVIETSEYDRPRARSHYVKTVVSEGNRDSSNGENNNGTNGEDEDEKRVWRPMISFDYPYHTVKTLNISRMLLTSEDEEEHPIFAVFHHIVKTSDKKAAVKGGNQNVPGIVAACATDEQQEMEKKEGGANTGADEIEARNRFVKATPTHIALYKLNADIEKDSVEVTPEDLELECVGIPFELSKAADKDFTEIDMKQMFGETLSELATSDDAQFYVVFVAKINDTFGIIEDSPVLHLHIHESDEYDFDEYFYSDEDDEEDDEDEDFYSDDNEYNIGDDADSENDGLMDQGEQNDGGMVDEENGGLPGDEERDDEEQEEEDEAEGEGDDDAEDHDEEEE